jgi:hypothetical protein
MSFIKFLHVLACLAVITFSHQELNNDVVSIFPMNNYDQTIATWINPNDTNYDLPLLTSDFQAQRLSIFRDHYFGSQSPWNEEYLNGILCANPPNDLKSIEEGMIQAFTNQGKSKMDIGYGENFRPHSQQWIDSIAANMQIDQLANLTYIAGNRAISVYNSMARLLPTNDVHYYSYKIAGQGYPFDNLQQSMIHVGTPVYIVSKSRDHAWSFVITPDYLAWVPTDVLTMTQDSFIKFWQDAAKRELAAITTTSTNINDENGRFLLSAYVGSVFPAVRMNETIIRIMVPAKNDDVATILYSDIQVQHITLMPLTATRRNFANVMSTLIGRTYGWGNMYFFNDCSGELKSLFTPFGIYVPRQSVDQVKAGKMVDMSSASPTDRLQYLMQNGKPFMTIIYIGGHIIMYIGNYPNPNSNDQAMMAMTYQNLWGLSPNPATTCAVIGEAVLFPMLLTYPEDTSLISLASYKYFQVSYLDQIPS